MIDEYIKAFTNLHSDKVPGRWSGETLGRAPHKPLLLLAVLDLFSVGAIDSNLVELTPDLVEGFGIYWASVMPSYPRTNIALPYYHLRNEGFWHLVPRPGQEAALSAGRPLRSLIQLQALTLGASLDTELYTLLQSNKDMQVLRASLIGRYFDIPTQLLLWEQSSMNVQSFLYSKDLLQSALSGHQSPTTPNTKQDLAVRSQGFRRAVVTAYEHRCAFCGIRVVTGEGHTAVAAAHIVPWRVTHNDDLRNGLALCHLCHWAYDEGLVGILQTYSIKLAPSLSSGENIAGPLGTIGNRTIIGPTEQSYWPNLESLDWHYRNVFRGR